MTTPAPSWDTTRVYGTWFSQGGTMLAGTYKVTIPARVANAADNVIIPAGTFAQGNLNVTPGPPSFDVQVPCNDDPDNSPNGWQAVIEVSFTGAIAGEKYIIDTPRGVPVNLRTVVLAASIPAPQPFLIRGVPGGLAELDADGDVIDADGVKVTGGGLPVDADLDDIADSATRLALTSAERTKLSGVATGATANSSNATLLARANHTGTQSADTLTDGTTNKAFLATERTKLSGVATSATANDTDANLKARSNHTGTQTASTISDFATAARTAVGVSSDPDQALSLGSDGKPFLGDGAFQPPGDYTLNSALKYVPYIFVLEAGQTEADVPADFPVSTSTRFSIIMRKP